MKRAYKSILPLGFISLACSFDDDRSLGSMRLVQEPATGGTTSTAQTSAVSQIGGITSMSISASPSTTAIVGVACADDTYSTCLANEYCNFDPKCGKDGSKGYCQPIPENCSLPTRKQSVCGCDANFYDSVCEASLAGVSETGIDFCPPVSCNTGDDCQRFTETCTRLFGWVAPQALCTTSQICSCGEAALIQ